MCLGFLSSCEELLGILVLVEGLSFEVIRWDLATPVEVCSML